MSTPASNWSYSSTPGNALKGKAVQALTIAQATVGSLAQVHAPRLTVPANIYYFKAYGGDSTSSGAIPAWLVADPAGSSAFSLSTGKFTAPVNGFYRFAGVVYAGGGNTHASLRRVRGEENITLQYVAINDSYGESSAFATECFLEAGDEVFMYVDDGRMRLADYTVEGFTLSALGSQQPRSTFEGRLVYETA